MQSDRATNLHDYRMSRQASFNQVLILTVLQKRPMSDPFSSEVSNRICKHMNEDHADAVLLYARAFGKSTGATAAEMRSIDAHGMDLLTQVNGVGVPLRIPFDRPLQDAEDAHHTLIAMVRQAREQ
jgi:putative heme iron utilization protein